MLRIQCYRIISIVFMLGFLSAGSLSASSATVLVSATVLPWVQMDVRQHQSSYRITPNDRDRTYLDLPYAVTVDIETNVSVLILTLVAPGGERIVASLNGANRFASTLEIALTEHEKYARRITRELDFRVLLDEDSKIGEQVLDAWISIQAY